MSEFMSDLARPRVNSGAYSQPFSGVGVEFDPLGAPPDRCGITLHEAGYLGDCSDWNFPAVFSPFWRLYHNDRRGHCVLFDEVATELIPGRLVLIPPFRFFHCLGKNPVPALWLAFGFNRRLDPGTPMPVVLPARETELCLIRDLARLIEAGGGIPGEAILHHSFALLQITLCRPELVWRKPAPAELERARSRIEREYASPLTVPELAATAGMGITGFARAFHREFGTTPARYVTGVRVREAARLLLETDLSIDQVADRTGFPNRAYFSRVFHKVTREWPAGFRRRKNPRLPT